MKKLFRGKGKYILICLLAIVVIVAALIFNSKKQEELKFEVSALDLTAYTELNDDRHVFKEVDTAEILKIMESGTGLIYIGRPSCERCQDLVPLLNKLAKSKEYEAIYYLNIEDYNIDESFQDEVDKILDNLRYYFEDSREIPITVAFMDGHIVGFSSKFENEKVYAEMIDILKGEKETTFEEYFKPIITIDPKYGELLTYVVGESFDINKYVTVKSYKDSKTEIHFEVINEEYEEYKQEGMHDIKIIVTDKFEVSEINAVLLTQKDEVIKKLTADNYKPTASDYQKYVKENPEVETKPIKGGNNVTPNKENNQGNNSSSKVEDATANAIVGNSSYYNYGCEAIAGVYHGFSTPNDILDAGVYEVSSPERGDIIAYFDAAGNYVHTGTYLSNGMALQGNWTGGKAVITSASYATYRKYLRLGGSTEYGRYIYNTSHSLGGNAGWLEDYYYLKDQISYTPPQEPEYNPGPESNITEEEYIESISQEEYDLAEACGLTRDTQSEACQKYYEWMRNH